MNDSEKLSMPLSSCDDDRLALAEEARSKFDEARELVKTGDYAKALECYLFAFDNSLAVSSWGGVRLSYIPSEIAKLGEKYPPAKIALQVRRDARESLIRDGETNYEVVAEWASINRYLNDHERELDLLKELQKNGSLSDSLKEKIVTENFDQLLEQKEYRLLGEFFNDFGRRFLRTIYHYEEARIFPDRRHGTPEYLALSRSRIAEKGANVFELALGLGRFEQADGIVNRVLMHCNCADSYRLLVRAAERAGKKRRAKDLSKRAKVSLDEDEYWKFSHPNENVEQTFTTLLSEALTKPGCGNEKFDTALAFLVAQNGVEACMIAGSDGSVLSANVPPGFDAKVIASEIADLFRTTEIAVNKMNHNELRVVVLRTLNIYWAVYNLDFALLIVLTDNQDDDLFSQML